MIEINLIPDVKQELLRAQRARSIVISSSIIASIVAVGVVALFLVYIFGAQTIRGALLDGNIDKKGAELANVEDLPKILTIQNQLKTINSLNDQKNMSSRVFDMIAAITPQGIGSVAFSQITAGASGGTTAQGTTGSTGGKITLEGQTANYEGMEIFKKTIENTIFQFTQDGETKTVPLAANISTGDISYGEDTDGKKVLRFMISFDYPAELLSPKTVAPVFKLNINGNVTDSYLGIPRFTERAKDLKEGE